jgi:hypothetical protein
MNLWLDKNTWNSYGVTAGNRKARLSGCELPQQHVHQTEQIMVNHPPVDRLFSYKKQIHHNIHHNYQNSKSGTTKMADFCTNKAGKWLMYGHTAHTFVPALRDSPVGDQSLSISREYKLLSGAFNTIVSNQIILFGDSC